MPGIPKTSACALCKARRTKCDEKWPTCSPCRRKGYTCPGPSARLKFIQVHHGAQTDHKAAAEPLLLSNPNPAARKRFYCSWDPQETSSIMVAEGRGKHHFVYRVNSGASIRPNPVSAADRVGLRLINHLNASEISRKTLMDYLQDLPKYLTDSPSLQASVNTICSLWADHRRGLPANVSGSASAYITAIRSMRYTLQQADKAINLETLASATILGRIDFACYAGDDMIQGIHYNCIASIMAKLGPPERKNKLYSKLISENFRILVTYFFVIGDNIFLAKPPWKSYIEDYYGSNVLKSLRPYAISVIQACLHCTEEAPTLSRKCVGYRKDPHNPQLSAGISYMIEFVRFGHHQLDNSYFRLLKKAIAAGEVSKVIDSNSLTGTAYEIKDIYMAEILMLSLRVHLFDLLIYVDWAKIWSLPEKTALAIKFRELSMEAWQYIPYIQTLEYFEAAMVQPFLYPTIDAASEMEKDFIIDFLVKIDLAREVVPNPKEVMEYRVRAYADIFAWREPIVMDQPMDAPR